MTNGQPYLVPGMNFSCDGNITQVVAGLNHPGTNFNILSLGVVVQIWTEVEASMGTLYSLVTAQTVGTNTRDQGVYTLPVEPPIPVSSGHFIGFLEDTTTVNVFGLRSYTRQLRATAADNGFTILRQTADPVLASDILQFYEVTSAMSPLLSVQFSKF